MEEKNVTKRFDAIILAAGDYPVRPFVARLLHSNLPIVCCDGAVSEFIEREGSMPWRVIGDGDSIPSDLRSRLGECFIHFAEQETNDLSKAMRYLKSHGYKRIAILGATGKREDHALGNISLLMQYHREGQDVMMFTDYGVFIPCSDCFDSSNYDDMSLFSEGSQVSIFSFGAKDLQSEGLRYAIYDFSELWQGTLNEMSADNFKIMGKGMFLVFVNYPKR